MEMVVALRQCQVDAMQRDMVPKDLIISTRSPLDNKLDFGYKDTN